MCISLILFTSIQSISGCAENLHNSNYIGDTHILDIAQEYFRNFDIDHSKMRPDIKDNGDSWSVTYVPINVHHTGGLPVVIVDKDTRKIINIYNVQ